MKNTGKTLATLLVGGILGVSVSGSAGAALNYLKAVPSANTVYVDEQPVQLAAYAIEGANYVKLRDICEALDVNVYWDADSGTVQIDTESPYTGEAPASPVTTTSGLTRNADGSINVPSDGSRYVPQAGDVIRCGDGTNYTITDVSRYDKSYFADGPVGDLPSPTCDWSLFQQPELPEAEARHFDLDAGDYLFIRNLYETRRMLYTIYNAAGNNPISWKDGKPAAMRDGTPTLRFALTTDDDLPCQSFWPWKGDQLIALFDSHPSGLYSMEVWDVFKDGIFIRTEYQVRIN